MAALALAAGAGVGLRLGPGADLPLAAAALSAAACCALAALRSSFGRRRGLPRRERLPLALALPAACLAGLGLGVRDGARADASCTAALRSGDAVVVEGESVFAVRPASGSRGTPTDRWARLELVDVWLARGREACRLPGLLVRVARPREPLPAGAHLRMVGEWRRFASPGRRAVRAPDRYGAVYGTLASAETVGPTPAAPLRALRARAAARLARLVPSEAAPAAKALVVAERSDLSPSVTRSFADAGMIHLLAISGLHVGLLAGGTLWAVGLVLGRRAGWLVAALVTAVYVAVIGAPAPAVRAALLFAGLAVTRWRGSPARPGDLLGWAVGLGLLASPLLLVDPGFQLSFAGWTGLFAGDRAAARLLGRSSRAGEAAGRPGRLRRRLRGPARGVAASLGAFAATAPIAAAHFGRVAPASILSSLAGAPLVALALAGLVPSLFLPHPLAALSAAGASVPIRGLLRLSDWFAGLPLHGPAPPPDAVAWAALALAAVGGALLLGGESGFGGDGTRPVARSGLAARTARARGAICCAAAVAIWTAAPGLRALGRGKAALLCTLDVGQGDAAALRTPRGHWIVFDAGPGPGFGRAEEVGGSGPPGTKSPREPGPPAGAFDAGVRVVVPFLRARGARAVDLFVLSHPHLDHLGGAAALFDAFPVKRALDAGVPVPSSAYLRYLGAVEEEGTRWLPGRAGARLRLDDVEILVLGPGEIPAAAVDPNEVSVAVRVQIGDGFVYVNTGDAPVEAEAELLRRWPADTLRADLLKLGHHGSRTSSSVAWLRAVRPRLSVLSVGGRNRYGHPHAAALARLDSAGVEPLWRTDRQGPLCVRVETDGRWRPVSP